MTSNRKARLLARVPVNICGNFVGYRVSNRVTLIYRKGEYYSTHTTRSRGERKRAIERERGPSVRIPTPVFYSV